MSHVPENLMPSERLLVCPKSKCERLQWCWGGMIMENTLSFLKLLNERIAGLKHCLNLVDDGFNVLRFAFLFWIEVCVHKARREVECCSFV